MEKTTAPAILQAAKVTTPTIAQAMAVPAKMTTPVIPQAVEEPADNRYPVFFGRAAGICWWQIR